MKAFIWFMFGSAIFSVLVSLLSLSVMPYPRTLKYERWEDSLKIALNLIFAFCAYDLFLK